MSPRALAVLVALGVVALAGGWYFGAATTPSAERSVDAGKLMFPGLTAKLQQATKIEVVHQGVGTEIDRRDAGNGRIIWGLKDRGGYPVQETKLRGMLTALTELRLVEPRTSDPTQFATLGVEDPNAKGAASNLLRVQDAKGEAMVAVIVGHRRVRTQGNVPDEVYVRRPEAKESWLAEGSLEVDADPQLWLDRDIMNIDHNRIAKVSVKRGDSTLQFARGSDKLTLAEPADHPKLDDYKLEDVARGLELLTFDDVHPTATTPDTKLGETVFSTSDGLSVTVTVFRAPPGAAAKPEADRDILAQFSVSGDDKSKPEADRLAARLHGWTYQLGAWKQKALLPSMDDLKAPPPKEPAAATGASSDDAGPNGAEPHDQAPNGAATNGAAEKPNTGDKP